MKYFFPAFFVVILLAACSKTTVPSTNALTVLTTGQWHVASGTMALRKPNGVDTILNYTDWIPYCHKDDYIEFKTASLGFSFAGPHTCNAADPDSVSFIWSLDNTGTIIKLQGFNFSYAALDTVYGPVFFDTSNKSPLVLDTIINKAAATALGTVVVLDSTWHVMYDSVSVPGTSTFNAIITDLSASSFTLNYSVLTYYLDSTNHHTGPTTDLLPQRLPDTIHYSVTYTP